MINMRRFTFLFGVAMAMSIMPALQGELMAQANYPNGMITGTVRYINAGTLSNPSATSGNTYKITVKVKDSAGNDMSTDIATGQTNTTIATGVNVNGTSLNVSLYNPAKRVNVVLIFTHEATGMSITHQGTAADKAMAEKIDVIIDITPTFSRTSDRDQAVASSASCEPPTSCCGHSRGRLFRGRGCCR